MAVVHIQKWLTDRNRTYEHGLQLFLQYCDKPLVKALLTSGNSNYHFKRLQVELVEINDRPVIEQPKTLNIPKLDDIPVPDKRHGLNDAEWASAPDAIKDLFTQNTRLHTHSQLLFNQSRITANEADREKLDLMIVDERNAIQDNWKTIKNFQETGREDEQISAQAADDIEKMTAPQLMALVKNYPTYLSKDRAKLSIMPDGPKKNKVLHRIREREIKLDRANQRLAEM